MAASSSVQIISPAHFPNTRAAASALPRCPHAITIHGSSSSAPYIPPRAREDTFIISRPFRSALTALFAHTVEVQTPVASFRIRSLLFTLPAIHPLIVFSA